MNVIPKPIFDSKLEFKNGFLTLESSFDFKNGFLISKEFSMIEKLFFCGLEIELNGIDHAVYYFFLIFRLGEQFIFRRI